jgi:hypothetical protein
MSPRYAMPLAPEWTATFDRREPRARNRRGQWHEMVQHLTDLAYLSVRDFRRWHEYRAEKQVPDRQLLSRVVTACRSFVSEDRAGDYRLVPAFPNGNLYEQTGWVERHLSLLVYRAELYTSFDGDLPWRSDYRVGERSALGRSLAFRIRTYFYVFTRGDRDVRRPYFGRKDLKYLYTLSASIGHLHREELPGRESEYIPAAFLELLASADLLFDRYRRANRLLPQSRGGFFWLYRMDDGIPEVNERRLERLSRRAGRRVRRESFHEDTGTNHLGIRLLQLGLWRAGCYLGRLDGAFGPLSHAAALRLVAQERERGEALRKRQYDRVILPVEEEDGVLWVIDLRLMATLLDAYVPPPREQSEREEDEIWERIENDGQTEQLEEAARQRSEDFRFAYGQLERHPLRRVYYGLRGLIRGAFRAIGRIVSWLAGAVREVLGAVFDFLKAVVKRIQEGTGLFFAGFRFFGHYLLGRPIVTVGPAGGSATSVLLTRHLFDFDVVNYASTTATVSDIERHGQNVLRMQRGAAYFLEVTAILIRFIATLQPPVGWLRLGVFLARRVRILLMGSGRARPLV